jgi:hypothetical protein
MSEVKRYTCGITCVPECCEDEGKDCTVPTRGDADIELVLASDYDTVIRERNEEREKARIHLEYWTKAMLERDSADRVASEALRLRIEADRERDEARAKLEEKTALLDIFVKKAGTYRYAIEKHNADCRERRMTEMQIPLPSVSVPEKKDCTYPNCLCHEATGGGETCPRDAAPEVGGAN